jgi:bifunctional DNA-binding transcriptional regulator/antitoxin component of YhaV-PrlF toxin-antitoxin module
MTEATRLDDRGRVTIHAKYRHVLGDRVVQIRTPHGILLRPVPDTLPDGGKLPEALRASGEDAARHEARA